MNAADTTVRLIPRPDGSLSIHDARTGSPLGVLPASALDTPVEPLEMQIETATIRRKRERSMDLVAGLVLGCVFVAGAVTGLLLSYL